MLSIAIIAEYNPFHTGHLHQIEVLRRRFGSEAQIVVLMSGSFVQRGEPALFDKWTRAAWAIKGGADCVFELPCAFALSGAADFATGGVRLAARLGCTHLSCGIEKGTSLDFYRLAQEALDLDSAQIIAATRHQGHAYGTVLTQALTERCPELAELLRYPNALLALEYVKALLSCKEKMEFIPIPRTNSHNNTALSGSLASASSLRHSLCAGSITETAPYFSPGQYKELCQLLIAGQYTDYRRYGDFLLYEGRRKTPDTLSQLAAFSEGIENRWHDVLRRAPTWLEGLEKIKTRRYPRSRLCRMGACTVLDISQEAMNQWHKKGPLYARLLAMRRHAGIFLRQAKQTIPIVTKVTTGRAALSPTAQTMLDLDMRATDLQHLCFYEQEHRLGQEDCCRSPVIYP